jgi:peptide/nickel transport system permease protein
VPYFLLKRSAGFVLTLFLVSFVTFMSLHLVPGDPIRLMVGPYASEAEVEVLRQSLGLDRPIPIQYFNWLGRVLQGDFGRTIQGNADVLNLILERLPATIALTVAALLITVIIALPIGIFLAIRRNSITAQSCNILVLLLVSTPTFWLGLILIFVFASQLRWFPTSGYADFDDGIGAMLHYLVLPAITLAAYETAWLTRTIRGSILDVMLLDFVRTARAKGLSEFSVIVRHILRNAWLPIITVIGLEFGYLLGGAVVVEQIFGWPGIGRLLVTEGIYRRDIPVVQGVTMFIATVFITVNFLVDLLYAWLDPRIRVG